MKINKTALVEAAKELGRVVVLAAVGFGLAYVTELPQTETTVVVLAVLRFVDKFLHVSPDTKVSGLVPF